MLTDEQAAKIAPGVLTLQIISAGILLAAVFFAVVIAWIVNWNEVTSAVPLMTLIAAGTALSLIMLSFVIPRVSSSTSIPATAHELTQAKRNVEDELTLQNFVQQLTVEQIIFSALIEGAIFLNLVVFLLDKSQVSLAVSGIGLAILILCFPTKGRLRNRIGDRMEAVRQEMRHFG